jgi:hypothetical protein
VTKIHFADVPAEGADATEVDTYCYLCHTASTIFIQVVSEDILEKIVKLEKPILMWSWFHTEYDRDSTYALVSQILNLVSYSTQYAANNLSDSISKYESQWLHLTKLLKASSDLYYTTFVAFLNEDKAK